jgi:NAD(P)-dependent dehydrogenase (short-subunit alcohol dehydrogenase family)
MSSFESLSYASLIGSSFNAHDTQNTPVVLLTGASSGIGLALARKLCRQDFRIVLTARPESLHKLKEAGVEESSGCLIRAMDVTCEAQRENVFREIESRWGGVSILINNAAISYRSTLEDMSVADVEHQMNTNFYGPVHLMRRALPYMRQRRSGRIINVSSVSGMMAMPTMGMYSASKFALEGISEALWYEVKPWGVNVTLVQPGFVHSESFRNVQFSARAARAEGPYRALYRHMGYFIERLMGHALATPESIAERIIKVMSAPRPPLRLPVTFDAHLFGLFRRFAPRCIYHGLLYRNLPGVQEWEQEGLASIKPAERAPGSSLSPQVPPIG